MTSTAERWKDDRRPSGLLSAFRAIRFRFQRSTFKRRHQLTNSSVDKSDFLDRDDDSRAFEVDDIDNGDGSWVKV